MTASDYAARKKRMAAILSDEEQAPIADVPQAQEPSPILGNSPADGDPSGLLPSLDLASGGHLIDVPLDEIQIDPHQPRQFLPTDLRRTFTSHQANHQDVLAQLMTRAAKGDIEAEAYLADIRMLADDIKAHGQLHAALVYTDKRRNGRTCYRLIDGERRFWAHVYLSAQPDSQMKSLRAELREVFEHASADDIRAMQWSANMQRDSIGAIDIAEFVYAKREEVVRCLELDPKTRARQREDGKSVISRDAAYVQQMVCRDLARMFGRPLKRRAYYQYLSLAEKLAASVKALARANKLPLIRLVQIAPQPEREQMAAILQMIESQRAPEDAPAKPSEQSKRPGRPTRSQSRIRLAERAVAGMDSDTEQSLLKWRQEELAAVLQKDRDLLEATDRHVRLVQAALSRR